MSDPKISVRVWDELTAPAEVYPEGIHGAVAGFLNRSPDMDAVVASIDDPEQGLAASELDATNVLVWWGHSRHGEVADERVDRVMARVEAGMGFVALHSAHWSKPFKRLLDASADIQGWREAAEWEKVFVTAPDHPIMAGVEDFTLPQTEMYKEHFDVPRPDETLMISLFEGGEIFRTGMTWTRGLGRVFYFRPGHESYDVFRRPQVQKIITQGVRWAANSG